MNRTSLKKTVVVALVAIGGLSAIGTNNAEAGRYRSCYAPSYSYGNATIYSPVVSYCSPSYVRTYTYAPTCNFDYSYSTWRAPTLYSPVTISSPYSRDYFGGYGGYGNGYHPATFSGYGYGGCGFTAPISYGQCGW